MLIGSAFAPVGRREPGLAVRRGRRATPSPAASRPRSLDLKEAPAGWAALDAEVAAALGDYRVTVFEERVPDEYVDDFCALLSAFIGEVPTGDLELEEASWTPERVRDNEGRAIAIGRVRLIGVAIAPDGHLCGFSDLRDQPRRPAARAVSAARWSCPGTAATGSAWR